ncbi:hypothetical protein [Thiohalorhabdus sp.]|uniref:hypothetical protein n=1 Tax=Thiohalorhabdus sp. TaxID=3094134 RepID=UPI002FC2D9E4
MPDLYELLGDGMEAGRYPLAERRTVVDPFVYVLTRWTDMTPVDLGECPALEASREGMEVNPGVERALEPQGMAG